MSRRSRSEETRETHEVDATQPAADGADARDDKPSKSQRKRDAHDLQKLGASLAALSDAQLARIAMDDELRAVIEELRRTRTHEGRRRQLQLVGKRMRSVDAEPLREALAAAKLGGAEDALALHRAESWRDALVNDDASVDRFVAEHPGCDEQRLRKLVRRVRDERTHEPAAAPGAERRHGPAWRELFRAIRPSMHAASSTPSAPSTP